MQMERRSMRWLAAAMAVVYLSACGGGGGDAPGQAGGPGSGASGSPSPSPSPGPSPSPALGGSPPPPPPAGTPPAAPPPGSGTAPIPDPGAPPAAPFTLTITAAPQRGLKLEWPAVAGANGYRIERDVDAGDGVDNFVVVGSAFVAAPGTSRTLTGLSLGEAINHRYRVRALSPTGPTLATATASVSGDLAPSINTLIDESLLDDSLDNVPRVMATALRYDSVHVLAVGQPGANQGVGTVRIYERSTDGGAWVKVQTLSKQSSSAPALQDHFGASVSLSPNGQYLAVGIPGDSRPTEGTGVNPVLNRGMDDVRGSGSVEVYRYSGAEWVMQAWFKAINAGPGDAFGSAVAITDDGNLLVGAPNEDSSAVGVYGVSANATVFGDDGINAEDRGAVYAYLNTSTGYLFDTYVKPSVAGPAKSLHFGAALAITGAAFAASARTPWVAVGAPQASFNGACAGGVVLYPISWSQTGTPWARWGQPQMFGPGGDRSCAVDTNPSPSSAAFRGLGGSLSMSQDGGWLAAGYADKGGVVTETGVALAPKARLKSPDPITDQFLGQATAITRDGNELLLSGEYKGDSSRPTGQAIFFGY